MRSPLYDVWRGMHQRCSNPAHSSFKYYGAKGIKVCERWASLANFQADMGPRPDGMSLDRIDSSKDYEPSNCRWATAKEQSSNKGDTVLVNLGGVIKPMGVWARELGASPQAIHYRVRKLGLSPQDALSFPASRATRGLERWKHKGDQVAPPMKANSHE